MSLSIDFIEIYKYNKLGDVNLKLDHLNYRLCVFRLLLGTVNIRQVDDVKIFKQNIDYSNFPLTFPVPVDRCRNRIQRYLLKTFDNPPSLYHMGKFFSSHKSNSMFYKKLLSELGYIFYINQSKIL